MTCPNGTYESGNNICIEKKISLDEFKDSILKNLSSYVNSTNVINGSDFMAIILSSDNMNPQEQLKKGISAIDLGDCNQVIKEYYNISNEDDFIILNIETKNNETENNDNLDDNSFNLGKNTQIELYDYFGNKLDLNVCKEDIKVLMNIKDVQEIDIQSSMDYSEQGIDVFNASDDFFNDLCHKYDIKDEIDIIINDRRSDIYQNVTFCQIGCKYNGINYDLMAANCLCNSTFLQQDRIIDNKKEEEIENINFKTLSKSFISNLLNFNIEVIYCYNLVFDSIILIKNIGFYCMLNLFIFQIIFLSIFLFKKLKPIKDFMLNFNTIENKKEPSSNSKDKNFNGIKVIDNNENETKNKDSIKTKLRTNSEYNINIKNGKVSNENINDNSRRRLNLHNDLIAPNNLIVEDNIQNPENKIKEINISTSKIQNRIVNINNRKTKKLASRQSRKINTLISKDDKRRQNSAVKIKDSLSNQDNQNNNNNLNSIKPKKKLIKKKKIKRKIMNIMETKVENYNNKYISKNNEDLANTKQIKFEEELQEMDYEDAIIYDKRSYIKIYWSSLVNSQIILGTFFTDNNLNLLIIKISFLFCIFQISFFLNALFYTDDYISDAYHNNGVLDFVSGLPKSIYSVLVTLIISNLLKMLSNSKNELKKLIKEKSKDKEYIDLINVKLKKLRNKLIIYFILVFLLGIFFLYYVSSFCAVYRYSQKYWFFGCLESFGMDTLIAIIICIIVAFFRFIAIKKKKKIFFILSNIIDKFL